MAAVHWIWLEGALRCAHASLAESRWQKLRNLFESSSLSLMYEMSTLKKDKSPEWKYFALVNEASHALTAENGADMWESGVPFMHSGVKLSLADLDCVLKVEDDRAALKINALKETKWPVTEDGFICNPSFPHVMKEAFEIFVEEERAATATAAAAAAAATAAASNPAPSTGTGTSNTSEGSENGSQNMQELRNKWDSLENAKKDEYKQKLVHRFHNMDSKKDKVVMDTFTITVHSS